MKYDYFLKKRKVEMFWKEYRQGEEEPVPRWYKQLSLRLRVPISEPAGPRLA